MIKKIMMMMTNVDKGKKLQIFENQLAFLESYAIPFQAFQIKLEQVLSPSNVGVVLNS